MRILGELCLQAAFVSAGYAAVTNFAARRDASDRLARHATRASVACLVALLASLGILSAALVAKDFRFEYVAHYTSQLLPWHFRLSALWVGQAGSLLLWTSFTAVLAMLFQRVS